MRIQPLCLGVAALVGLCLHTAGCDREPGNRVAPYGNAADARTGGVAPLVFAPTLGGVLFSDDFNRSNPADLGPNWNVLAGVWFDNGKAAQTDRHPLNRATVANISCGDCRIDAQMVNFGGGDSMLELRAGSTDRYALALRTDGVLEIRRYSGGGVTVLGSLASGITDLRNWNSFSFVVQGSAPVSLTGYVNGTPKVTATDASSAALTAPGAAGMAATLAGVLFDNFTLSGISSGGGGALDGGVGDGGISDGGLSDGGAGDAGTGDAGITDGGSSDGGTPTVGVLFSDDFNRSNSTDLGPNWNVLAGVWFDNGKAAQTDRHPLNRATVANISCAECRIDAQMVNFGGGDSMLELRAGSTGWYALALRTDGVLEIRRYSGGGVTVLGSVASGITDLMSWNSFSFVVQGTAPVLLTGYVNGTPKITATDASSAALTAPGAAGMAATLAGILFDNFTLSGTGSGGGGAPGGGITDGGLSDGGTGDAGTGDAGVTDGGTSDGGTPIVGVLFSDDFNRSNSADLGPNWNVLAGVWFDNGTAAQTDSHPLNRARVSNISCADCRIDAQMVNFGGGDSMLELRAGSTGWYALALRTDGVLEIRRYSGGGVTVLGSVASGITDLRSWNSFSFVVQGTAPVSLTGYVNGTPKVTATDASSAALTAPGAAGMAATLAGILFDNFTLSGISSGGGGALDGGVGDGGVGDGGLGDGGSPPSGDWPFYRHDLGGTSNGGGSISASQAASLKVLFKVSIPASVANPVVASGTLFVASGSGKLLALDPRTGATRWSRSTGVSSLGTCATYSQGAVGAAAVVGSTVFAPGGDGRVYAFDTATGNQLWATQIANTANDEFLWSSAIPIGGGVYIGIATLEEAACSLVVPGRLVGLDQATGAVTSTWWSDVDQGAGGGIWTSAAFDPILGRIFVTTGNVANGVSATSEPWQQAFVSIDPSTMHTADSYQPIQTDFSTDWDFGASPTLFDASGRHLVAAANKNGLVYALERTNLSGGVLWTSPISGSGDSPDLGVGSIVSPTFASGLLFVAGGATTDGYPGAISALDPATGTTVWKMHPDGFVLPAMAAAGGVLAAGVSHSDGTGRIYVLDQTSGAALFTLATAGKIFGEPTWANGVLYVVDLAGYLYALSP